MNEDVDRPSSRRERPAKPALTREGIVAAALGIMARDGLSKVTMRCIAAALDTGAASLYVYVRNTEDLHAQILDALLDSVPQSTVGDWRERLTEMLSRYLRVLLEHHEIARMTMTTHPSGPHYLALVNTLLVARTSFRGRGAGPGVRLGDRSVAGLRHGYRRRARHN